MHCPVCEQDELGPIRVAGRPGLLCPECDSLWFEGVTPSIEGFHQLGPYLNEFGLTMADLERV